MTEATSEANRLATVFGGSGFLGRHIVRALARKGWRIRVAVRRPDLAAFLTPLGGVGQIQPVQANVRFPGSIAAALEGASAAVNATGVKAESGAQTYAAVHVEGALALARAALSAGVATYVHVSGIGADAKSSSPYIASKGLGEQATRDTLPDTIVMRPSVVFGPEDDFFNRFGALACHLPVLPLLAGGKNSLAAGLRRRRRTGGRRSALRLGESGLDLRAGGSEDDDAARSRRARLAHDRSPSAPDRGAARSVALDRSLESVRIEDDIRPFSEIADDDSRSGRSAGVGQHRLRRGGSRRTRPEGPRDCAAGRRSDHPVLSSAISPDGTV